MVTIEQVEKLREKANVSYDEAKAALEASNGDLLEAVIYLEKQGKVKAPEGGGYYSSDAQKESSDGQSGSGCTESSGYSSGENFGDLVKRFIRFCGKIIHKGIINSFEIYKDNERKTSFPIILLVALIVFAFWISIPLIIIGLFFGFRYRFSGPDFNKSKVNDAMDTAANTAEDIKKSLNKNN